MKSTLVLITCETLILVAASLAMVFLFTGCAFTGKVSEGECKATMHVSVGVATGPCGLAGGGFSVPGAAVVGKALEAAGGIVAGILGRSPVVIENHGTEKQAAE